MLSITRSGNQTLRTQDSSDPKHFSTGSVGPNCSAPPCGPKHLALVLWHVLFTPLFVLDWILEPPTEKENLGKL